MSDVPSVIIQKPLTSQIDSTSLKPVLVPTISLTRDQKPVTVVAQNSTILSPSTIVEVPSTTQKSVMLATQNASEQLQSTIPVSTAQNESISSNSTVIKTLPASLVTATTATSAATSTNLVMPLPPGEKPISILPPAPPILVDAKPAVAVAAAVTPTVIKPAVVVPAITELLKAPPAVPVIVTSVAPVDAIPAAPAVVTPVAAVIVKPVVAVDAIPVAPVIVTPVAAVVVTPVAPVIVTPVAPVIVTPVAPVIVTPVAPVVVTPVVPLAVAPVLVTPVIQVVSATVASLKPVTVSAVPVPLPAATEVKSDSPGGAAVTSSTSVVAALLPSSSSVPKPDSAAIKPLSAASAISPFAELTSSTQIQTPAATVTVAVAEVNAIPSKSVQLAVADKPVASPPKKVSKNDIVAEKEEEGMTDREERIEKKSGKVTEGDKIKGDDAVQTKHEAAKLPSRGNMSVVMRSTTGRQANTVVLIKPTEGLYVILFTYQHCFQ